MAGTRKKIEKTLAEDVALNVEAEDKAKETRVKKAAEECSEKKAKKSVSNVAENIKTDGGKLSLEDVSKIVNAIVDSLFIECNGKIEFAAEYYEVLPIYMEIGAFYPETGAFKIGLSAFFVNYIDGKYYAEIEKLKYNRLAQYIDNAVKQKIETRKRLIEDPLIGSVVKFVDAATSLVQKSVDDFDNIGAADMQKFIKDFGEFANKNNAETMTEAVIKMHKAAEPNTETIPAVKKRSGRSKKSEQGVQNGG